VPVKAFFVNVEEDAMITAVYARKSNEQTGVADESVTRQPSRPVHLPEPLRTELVEILARMLVSAVRRRLADQGGNSEGNGPHGGLSRA
jgi:hypothetical protein